MNEPIISPWIFYLIDMADGLKIAWCVVSFMGFAVAAVAMVEEGISKWWAIGCAALLCIGLLMPTSATVYKMAISSYVTPNNIELLKGGTKGLVDYIVERAGKIGAKEKQ